MDFSFSAYGLRIRSEIEVPFAIPGAEAEPDLSIRFGAVPESLSGAARVGPWQVAPGRVVLNANGVARYLIRDGREIVVEVSGAVGGEPDVRTFLVGSVLGACLQLRGRFALHGSAVETGAGAALFLGDRGSGKSTLLAALLDRGFRMLADDVCAIALDADGRPEVFGGFPQVRLWAAAMERLGWNRKPAVLEEARGRRRKWSVPVERFRDAPLAVRTIFVLSNRDQDGISIEPAAPSAALVSLSRHTYRPRLVPLLGLERTRFRMAAASVRHASVIHVRRPRGGFLLEALAERIAESVGEDRFARVT